MNLDKRLDQIERTISPANGLDNSWYEAIRRPVDQILATMHPSHRALVRREIAIILRTALPYPSMNGPNERIYVAGKAICLLTWAVIDMARKHAASDYPGALCFPEAVSRYYVDVLQVREPQKWRGWPPMLDPGDFCPYDVCGFQWMPADFRREAAACPACNEPLPPRMTGWDCRQFTKDMDFRERICEQAIERLGVEGTVAWLAAHGWEVGDDAA